MGQDPRGAVRADEGDGTARPQLAPLSALGLPRLPGKRAAHGTNPAWDSLDPDRRADLARRMAIFAGMVDRMDQNIGRVVARPAPTTSSRTRSSSSSPTTTPVRSGTLGLRWKLRTEQRAPSRPRTRRHGRPRVVPQLRLRLGQCRQHPWRLYKHYGHEGISTPLIVHWPAGIEATPEKSTLVPATSST